MKKFIENNLTLILFIFTLLVLFKSCGDSRELSKLRKDVQSIKDSTYTKQELNIVLQIEGLKAEKRMIQATDRKMLDVQRQTKIDEELSKLNKDISKY